MTIEIDMSQAEFYGEVRGLAERIETTYFHGCHIAIIDPPTYLSFNPTKFAKFWKSYCSYALVVNEDEAPTLEEICSHPPIDLFFNFQLNTGKAMMLDELVYKTLIREAHDLIYRRIRLENTERELVSVVMVSNIIPPDRTTTANSRYYQVQLLIRFPHLHIDLFQHPDFNETYRQQLQDRQVELKLDAKYRFVNFYDSLMVDYHTRHPPMYRGRSPPFEQLNITKIYNDQLEAITPLSAFNINDPTMFPAWFQVPSLLGDGANVPLAMSLNYGFNGTGRPLTRADPTTSEDDEPQYDMSTNYFTMEAEMFQRMKFPAPKHIPWLLEHLDPERLTDPKRVHERCIIGQAVRSVYDKAPEWYEVWKRYLPPGKDDEVRLKFNELADDRYTGRTLLYMVRQDDCKAYGEWHREQCQDVFDRCFETINETNVATVFHRLYSDRLFYEDVNRKWYIFDEDENRLRETTDQRLYYILSIGLVGIIEYVRVWLQRQLEKNPNATSNEREAINTKIIRGGEIINRLRTSAFKDRVIREARSLFIVDKKPTDLFDASPDILCVRSGVFVFHGKTRIFRKGLPEDFCTRSTKVRYEPDAVSQKTMHATRELLAKIYPDPEVLEFVMDYHATILRGVNREKIFWVMVSSGNTGKSTVINLLENVLGDYLGKYNYSDISVEGRRRGGPNPARAEAAFCRLVIVQETGKEFISKEAIKEETGIDSYRARSLYQNGGVLRPLYWFGYVSNFPPVWQDADDAIRNRCIYIPHQSKFTNELPKNNPHQRHIYKSDPTIQDRLMFYAQNYLVMLFNRYPKAAKKGIRQSIPKAVADYTKQYLSNDDIMKKFMEANLLHDATGSTTTDDIYKRYTVWCRKFSRSYDNRHIFGLEFQTYALDKDHAFKDCFGYEFTPVYEWETDSWKGISLRPLTTENKFQQQ